MGAETQGKAAVVAYGKYSKRRPRKGGGPPAWKLDPHGDWKACTAVIDKGSQVLGTLTIGTTVYALVKLPPPVGAKRQEAGGYAKVKDGIVEIVTQRRIDRLLQGLAEKERPRNTMVPVSEYHPPKGIT